MALEIERRFIVKGDEWKTFANEIEQLQQAYLSTNFDEWIVRMRIINQMKSEITLKAFAGRMTNHEFEYPIPLEDALAIWNLITKKIRKIRHKLNFGDDEWIVDCFQGKNYPLVLAEVELHSESKFVKQPSWCSKEITGIKKFSNAALAQLPISAWSIEERQSFNLS